MTVRNSRIISRVLFTLALCYVDVASAEVECAAHAERRNASITDKGKYYVDFTVTGKPCKEGCSGHIDYRIHVLRKDGSPTWDSSSVSWQSKMGEPVEVTDTSSYGHCHTVELGPCELRGVEILDVSCRL